MPTNPYVGLRPFFTEDHSLFFGRERHTSELAELLRSQRLVGVIGNSGAGKSSLIRAGLIPLLGGGYDVHGVSNWTTVQMKPGEAPFASLAAALLETVGISVYGADRHALSQAIREDGADAVVNFLHAHGHAQANLLLLVDQFDEIFAFRRAESLEARNKVSASERRAEADAFVALLLSLAGLGDIPFYVVLTLQSGALGHCDLFPDLPEALNRGRYLLPRLTPGELRDAIERPAQLNGMDVSSALSDAILNSLGDRFDRLPIVQHALHQTLAQWRSASAEGPLDLPHFLAAGGLDNALSQDAEQVLHDLVVQGADVDTVGRLFKRLTDTDADRNRICTPARASELAAASGLPQATAEYYLACFQRRESRFLISSNDDDSQDPVIAIAHQSLIRQWHRLTEWVDEERQRRDQFRDLVIRARQHHVTPEAVPLLTGAELRAAEEWRSLTAPNDEQLALWAERYLVEPDDFRMCLTFLDQSEAREALAMARVRTTRARFGQALAVFSVACLLVAWWAWHSKNVAVRERDIRRAQQLIANAQLLSASDPTSAALALTDGAIAALRDQEALRALQRIAENDISLAVLRPDSGGVNAVSVSDDGYVVTAGRDGVARIYSQDGRGAPIRLAGGHRGPLLSAAFSPDGSHIVTTSSDSTAVLWVMDSASGPSNARNIAVLNHSGRVYSAGFSGDGRYVVTSSADGTAKLWSATGSPMGTLAGHRAPVVYAEFSPDGALVVTASMDSMARVFRVSSREEVSRCQHRGRVKRARFDASSQHIVTVSSDSTANLCQALANGPARVLAGHMGEINDAAFSHDGQYVVTASNDRTARIWSTAPSGNTKAHVLVGHTEALTSVQFSPGDSLVVTTSADGTARVWYANDSVRQSIVLRGHDGAVSGATFNADGSRIVTYATDGTARVWRTRGPRESVFRGTTQTGQGTEARLTGHRGDVFAAEFDSSGLFLVTASADNTARIWTNLDNATSTVLRHGDLVHSAHFSRDGMRVVTASDDKTAVVWSQAGEKLQTLSQRRQTEVLSARFDPAGRHVVTTHKDGAVELWAIGDSVSRRLTQHDAPSWTGEFSHDGRRVVSSSWDGTVHVSDVSGSAAPVILSGHRDKVHAAHFSPTDDRIASASDDGTARIWFVAHRDSAIVLNHSGAVLSIAFSPDGRHVVTASRDSTVRVWSSAGQLETVLRGHFDQVWMAAFSPDGQSIVSTSYDQTVRLWPLAGGHNAQVFSTYPGVVMSAAFSPDSKRLAATSIRGSLSMRWLGVDNLVALVRASTTECLSVKYRMDLLGEPESAARTTYAACEKNIRGKPLIRR